MPSHNESTRNADEVALAARSLECWRGERRLFTDVSLRVGRSQILQVRGRNGAGKTTLLRTLAGLCAAEQGELLWRGEPVPESLPTLRADLNYIGHLDAVKLDLSAAENIDFARSLQASPSNQSTGAILHRLGLENLEDSIARTLSAGQRRRVALSRLLSASTTLWILDEPFTALDSAGEAIMRELLVEHLDDGGIVVFTSHQPVSLDGFAIIGLDLDS